MGQNGVLKRWLSRLPKSPALSTQIAGLAAAHPVSLSTYLLTNFDTGQGYR
jgi:hypothetical protein